MLPLLVAALKLRGEVDVGPGQQVLYLRHLHGHTPACLQAHQGDCGFPLPGCQPGRGLDVGSSRAWSSRSEGLRLSQCEPVEGAARARGWASAHTVPQAANGRT